MVKIRLYIFLLIGLVAGSGLSAFLILSFQTKPLCTCASTIELAEDSIIPVTNREFFEVTGAALRSASSSIHIVMFEMKYYTSEEYANSTTNLLLKDLIDAKARGVDVKIILDEYGDMYGRSYASQVIEYLEQNGIEDIKLDGSKTTTHCKLLIIDGEIVIVGSTNWSYYALDRNNEANVLIKSKEAAQEFEEYFEQIWNQ